MSRVRANEITNQTASGAPRLSHGVVSSGVITATSFEGNVTGNTTGNLTGDVTGNLTGDVTGNLIGNITGVAATFTGNVTIGGTLTYEDVTNVDSVGLITARSGIQVNTGGITVVGVSTFNDDIVGDNATNISGINSVTATSFYGDGSGLTGVSGGGGGSGPGGSGGAQIIPWNTSRTALNDNAYGRLDVFGGGNFTVFYEPGNFDTTGITSMRARVIGAGSYGGALRVRYPYSPYVMSSAACPIDDTNSSAGGNGGGYTHKVFASTPGGNICVNVGSPYYCGAPATTIGDSCFGPGLVATGGLFNANVGCGSGGDFNANGGRVLCARDEGQPGGGAGSQAGNASDCGTVSCSYTSPTGVSCTQCFGCCDQVANFRQVSRTVSRFPFDVLNGYNGIYSGPVCAAWCGRSEPGCGGGSAAAPNTSPGANVPGSTGGLTTGGDGGGGGYTCGRGGYGGGGGAAQLAFAAPPGAIPPNACNLNPSLLGGAGGPGVVIVEW